jgi:hypothetical protein
MDTSQRRRSCNVDHCPMLKMPGLGGNNIHYTGIRLYIRRGARRDQIGAYTHAALFI